MKQKNLFALKPKKEEKVEEEIGTEFVDDPIPTELRQTTTYIPKEGDIIHLLNINNGIEAVVEYVDYKNLYNDYYYPIQTRVPKLNDMMFRTNMKMIKKKD